FGAASLRRARNRDVALLRRGELAVPLQFGGEQPIGSVRHGIDHKLAFCGVFSIRQDGHRSRDKLETHIVENRWKPDDLGHRAHHTVSESFSRHQTAKLIRMRETVLGSLDAGRLWSELFVKGADERMSGGGMLDRTVYAQCDATAGTQNAAHFA